MAHITKATRGQVGGLIAHDERSCDNHTNEKIRIEDSHLNYNILDEFEQSPLERYNQIIEDSYVLNRKDVNTLAMVSVTLPKDIKEDDEDIFFLCVYQYLSNHFGADSVVSSIVHRDETTPHIHFKAVPRYWNEKKERYQVSFDKVCPRSFYQNLHKELSKEIEGILGYKVSIENGATIDGNKTIKELKSDTIATKKEIDKLKDENKRVHDELEPIRELNCTAQEISQIKPKKDILGHIKDISIETINMLKKMALETAKWRDEALKLRKENKSLKDDYSTLGDEYKKLENNFKENMPNMIEQAKVRAELHNLKNAIERLPSHLQQAIKESFRFKPNKNKTQEQEW